MKGRPGFPRARREVTPARLDIPLDAMKNYAEVGRRVKRTRARISQLAIQQGVYKKIGDKPL